MEEDMVICPMCGGESHYTETLMGCLGDVEYHRCKWCHWDFQMSPKESPEGFIKQVHED